MTFEEALKNFKEGKWIRRPGWTPNYSWNNKQSMGNDECYECGRILELQEIMADDWEVFEE